MRQPTYLVHIKLSMSIACCNHQILSPRGEDELCLYPGIAGPGIFKHSVKLRRSRLWNGKWHLCFPQSGFSLSILCFYTLSMSERGSASEMCLLGLGDSCADCMGLGCWELWGLMPSAPGRGAAGLQPCTPWNAQESNVASQ